MTRRNVTRTTRWLRSALVVWFVLALVAPGPSRAQTGEIYFVFGSDTSTGGFDLSRPSTRYNAGGFDLYAAPTGNGKRVMDDAFRAQNTDWYGDPLRLTWWMQSGSLYATAENTNVPLGSTLSPYRMRTYLGDAMQRHGDEFTFHYHTWVWSDYDGDGRWWWNQALSFDESREDFDRTMAQMLVEEDVFPVSFRSGWHYMDDAWQAHLDRLVPFSLHNDWPHARTDTQEPTDNIYDWSRAPSTFVPFHPSTTDYQVPGDGASWNVRSVHFGRATDGLLHEVFEVARTGQDQVVCIWSHLAESSFVDDLQAVLDRVATVAGDYAEVPFRYTTAVDAMQRFLDTADHEPPALGVETVTRPGGQALRITASEPLFQDGPFVAMKDRYERHAVLPVHGVGAGTWETDAFDPDLVATLRIAATDTVGNLAKETVRHLPDDLFVDNAEPEFVPVEGSWQAVGTSGHAHVWGTDITTAVLAEGQASAARWSLPVTQTALYNAFVRMPEVDNPAERFRVALLAGGATVAERVVESTPPPDSWVYVGSAALSPADAPVIEIRADGDGQAGSLLAADAVRLTALVRDRQLHLPPPGLDVPDVIAGEEVAVALAVENLGVGRLTIEGIQSESGVISVVDPLPVALDGPVRVRIALRVSYPTVGTVVDTLVVTSDDPLEPVRRVPFRVTFRDWFAVADNDDATSYEETGAWSTSVTQAYGASSRYVSVASAGSASATFRMDVERAGVHAAEFIVPRTENAALRADYLVSVDGERIDSLRIDQNAGSGAWRPLGLYDLEPGTQVQIVVRASDTNQSGRVLRADAVRLSRVGDALRETVLDDANAGEYEETGAWHTSVAQAWGPSSRWSGAGSGASALFHTVATHSGLHVVYEIVPTTVNSTTEARYRVLRNGALLESVIVDQNAGSGSWRPLGAWHFDAGDDVGVEVSDAATSPSAVLRADAVRLVFGTTQSTAVQGDVPAPGWTLGPNWPNPFSGSTRFEVTAPAAGRVTIELFDVLGRRVATVLDDALPTGTHTVTFDAGRLSSGVYLCRLRAPGISAGRTWIVSR